jgi:flagellar motor protein MotB
MQPSKPGSLGKSLGDLIGGLPQSIGSAASISSTGFVRLAPSRIRSPQDREVPTNSLPDSFLTSVREHGILQPLLVRKADDGYELVAGARRLTAAKTLGLADVPAIIIQASDDHAARISIVENQERTSPPPVAPEPTQASPAPIPTATTLRGRLLWASALAFALLIGAAAGWFSSNHQSNPAPAIVIPPVSLEQPPVTAPAQQEKQAVIKLEEFGSFTKEQLTVEKAGYSLRIVIQSPLFSYRTSIDESQKPLLKELGAIFARHAGKCAILITGHTDATPIRGSNAYRDNNDLGLARASEVARFLWRQAGVPVGMLAIATAGPDNPPFPSDTTESDRRNRTTTILISPCYPVPSF